MRSKTEIEDRLKEVVSDHMRFNERFHMAEILVLDWILDEPDVPCYCCTTPNWKERFAGKHKCPVCSDSGVVRPFKQMMQDIEKEKERQKVIEEWGIH